MVLLIRHFVRQHAKKIDDNEEVVVDGMLKVRPFMT